MRINTFELEYHKFLTEYLLLRHYSVFTSEIKRVVIETTGVCDVTSVI